MRRLLLLCIVILLAACSQQNNDSTKFQSQVDSLQVKLNNSYKPGLGEFMLGIQLHHAKLWFAGENRNWELADFEVHEIRESLENIKKYCTDRPEVKNIGLIDPAINSINEAIKKKDMELFKTAFTALTTNCNNCHKTSQHAFNVVIIPTALPVVNQDFKSSR